MIVSQPSQVSDQALIKLVLAGQTEKFTELIKRYQTPLYYFLYRFTQNQADSQDLAQETFTKAFFKLRTFKPDKKFSTWLYTIAHHQAINFFKRKKINLSLEELAETGQEVTSTWQPSLILAEQALAVRTAIKQLPPIYREVVTLYYQQELSYEEISQITKKPLNTVRTHLHRAKLQLEKLLQNYERA
ncbi:MAG: RNA polymerase sigma factor [Candidatus Buchananbacteria bacterium]